MLFFASFAILLSLSNTSCTKELNENFFLSKDIDSIPLFITDTVTIRTFPYTVDSVFSNTSGQGYLGVYNDPIFGKTKASFVSEFSFLTIPDSDAGITFTPDSVVLELFYDSIPDNYYGNTGTKQTVNVYELNQRIYSDSLYYSNMDITSLHDGRLLGTETFTPFIGNDSILSIKIDNNLAESILINQDLWVSSLLLRDFFNGIVVTTNNISSDGALLSFMMNSEWSRLKIYYHTETTDSLDFILDLNTTNAMFNLYEHDYSNTSFYSSLNSDLAPELDYAYLQGAAGLKSKVVFPFLQDWPADNVYAIQNAELVVTTVDEMVSTQNIYSALPVLKLLGINEDGEDMLLEDFYDGLNYAPVAYDDIETTYSFNITYHIEQLINNKREGYGLFLSPYSGNTNPHRSLIGSGKNDQYKLKLILTYSKP